MTRRLLTIPEAAHEMGVSRNTVYRMIATGVIRAVQIKPRTSKRSRSRIPATEIDRLAGVR